MVNTREVNLVSSATGAHARGSGAALERGHGMVDGRILKRSGRLTALDVEQTVSEASSALAR